MDPNETLENIRKSYARILYTNGWTTKEADYLATNIEALDEWIMNGGFLPTPWIDVAIH